MHTLVSGMNNESAPRFRDWFLLHEKVPSAYEARATFFFKVVWKLSCNHKVMGSKVDPYFEQDSTGTFIH